MKEILFSFKGRINRLGYWGYSIIPGLILIVGITTIIAPIVIAKSQGLNPSNPSFISSILVIIGAIIAFWMIFSLQVKRLHDIGYSGWWLLLTLIPYIGMIISLIIGLYPGNKDVNKYDITNHSSQQVA